MRGFSFGLLGRGDEQSAVLQMKGISELRKKLSGLEQQRHDVEARIRDMRPIRGRGGLRGRGARRGPQRVTDRTRVSDAAPGDDTHRYAPIIPKERGTYGAAGGTTEPTQIHGAGTRGAEKRLRANHTETKTRGMVYGESVLIIRVRVPAASSDRGRRSCPPSWLQVVRRV
jgi:hypothetical protein